MHVLELLCRYIKEAKSFYPRINQMISWTLLALSDNGRLLELATGEGKSCVIAMFAVYRVLTGEKVDIVSSSPILAQRDASEWEKFLGMFGITVDTNTDTVDDSARFQCYKSDIVYGTVESFAADHLRQNFEKKEYFPIRSFPVYHR